VLGTMRVELRVNFLLSRCSMVLKVTFYSHVGDACCSFALLKKALFSSHYVLDL